MTRRNSTHLLLGLRRSLRTARRGILMPHLFLLVAGLLLNPVAGSAYRSRGTRAASDDPVGAVDVPTNPRILNFGVRVDQSGLNRPAGVGVEYHPGRVLVSYKDGTSEALRQYSLEAVDSRLVKESRGRSSHFDVVHIPRQALDSGVTVEETISRLKRDRNVLAAEPDYVVRAQKLPNDPSFPKLWGLHNTGKDPYDQPTTVGVDVDASDAWDLTTGSSTVIVAIVDTGVDYTHEDLAANILRDSSGNVVGYDYYNKDSDPMDDNGHGTHVAGTIGAVGNNGIGVAGVNWNVRIMPLKFLSGGGSGYTSDAIPCIDFAISHGAHVINNSWGGGGFSTLLLQAIKRAEAAGILFTAAAGNAALNNDASAFFPANYNQYASNVVSVAASDGNDLLANYSNYGPKGVDIVAPGTNIYSTLPGNKYGTLSGTSMATPHVTGAIALIKSMYPTASMQTLKERLLYSVDRPYSLAGYTRSNRLNLAKALDDDHVGPGIPAAFAATHSSSSGFKMNWIASGEDGSSGTISAYELLVASSRDLQSAILYPLRITPCPPGASETASISGLLPDTVYYLGLQAIDNVGNRSAPVPSGAVRTNPVAFYDSVESAPRFSSGYQWLVTTDAAHSGTHSYASGYSTNTYTDMTSNSIIHVQGAATLKFWAKTDLGENTDYLWVYTVVDGVTYYESYLTGTTDWSEHSVDLTKYAGKDVRIRFVFTATATDGPHQGIFLDDIQVLPSTRVFIDDVEASPQFSGLSPWAVTQETAYSGTHSYSDSPYSKYVNNITQPLIQNAPVRLSEYDSPIASFKAKFDLENNRDFLDVFASPDDGANWEFLTSLTGTVQDWSAYGFRLPGYRSARLMFVLRTNEAVNRDGVYLDNIEIWGDPYTALVPTKTLPAQFDWNGDDQADILWRNYATGENLLWNMNGTSHTGAAALPVISDTNWIIAGVADFNGDSKPDLLWRHSISGASVVWLMNGPVKIGELQVTTNSDPNWRIVGVSDMDSDGRPDLLWRNRASGENAIWFMNGATLVREVRIEPLADGGWEIAGLGDFDGDGQTDILWRNKGTGQNAVWFMKSTVHTGTIFLDTVADLNWQVGCVADFNGDGQIDILWRNGKTGENLVWYMSGAAVVSSQAIDPVADINWKIAP